MTWQSDAATEIYETFFAPPNAIVLPRDETIERMAEIIMSQPSGGWIDPIEPPRETLASLHEEIEKLRREIAVDDQLLADRNRILDLAPCPRHGPCVPYVTELLACWRLRAPLPDPPERSET